MLSVSVSVSQFQFPLRELLVKISAICELVRKLRLLFALFLDRIILCWQELYYSAKMSSGLDVLSGSGSLRVRNSNSISSGGTYTNHSCKISEVKLCPSVMSPETKRLLPPNTETVQTKPFPIRGKWQCVVNIGLSWFMIPRLYTITIRNVKQFIEMTPSLFLCSE